MRRGRPKSELTIGQGYVEPSVLQREMRRAQEWNSRHGNASVRVSIRFGRGTPSRLGFTHGRAFIDHGRAVVSVDIDGQPLRSNVSLSQLRRHGEGSA